MIVDRKDLSNFTKVLRTAFLSQLTPPFFPQPQEVALAQQMKGVVMPHIRTPKKEKARGISKRQKKYSCFNSLRRVSVASLHLSHLYGYFCDGNFHKKCQMFYRKG